MDPQLVPYTASEFEEYAVMQGMGLQGGLSMWHEAVATPQHMNYCRRSVAKCAMEKAILVNSTVDVRRLMEIDITKATKHLQGLEPPISPMAFAVCMRVWNVLECLFTHAGVFGSQAMQAL